MKLVKFVTQELMLKEVIPTKDFKEICEEHRLDENVIFIRKGITASDLEFKDGERAIISHITTDTVDRDGEIVDPDGAFLKDYEKNPVVLFGHDHRNLPIGRNMWIKRDEKGLVAKTIYATHQQAEDVYQYRKQGFPLAQSIGFIPIETVRYEEGSKERKQGIFRKFTKWILLEYSDVPVPSNPDAIAIAISKGLIPNDSVEKVEGSSEIKSDELIDSKEETKILEQKETEKEDPSTEKPSVKITVEIVKAELDNEEKELDGDYFIDDIEEKDISDDSIIVEEDDILSIVNEKIINFKNDIKKACISEVKDELLRMKGKV